MSAALSVLAAYLPSYGYVALFFVMLITGTDVPLPGGLVLLAVGAFAREGHLNIVLAFCAALAGSVTSDVLAFFLARKLGMRGFYKRYVEKHKFARRIEAYAQKYPKRTIFLSRFIGFASTPVNVIVGLSQIRLGTFLSMDVLGDGVCTFVYLVAGYVIGITAAQAHFTTVISIVLGALVVLYAALFIALKFVKE